MRKTWTAVGVIGVATLLAGCSTSDHASHAPSKQSSTAQAPSKSEVVTLHGIIRSTNISLTANELAVEGYAKLESKCGYFNVNVADGSGHVLRAIKTATPTATKQLPGYPWKNVCTVGYSATVPVADVYELTMPDDKSFAQLTVNRSDLVSGAVPTWSGLITDSQ